MDKALLGKKVIITGGSRGIGFAIAKLFVVHGADIEIWGVNSSKGEEAAQELASHGGNVAFAKVDVSVEAEVSSAVDKFLEKHGVIDVLVNNAGITRDGLLLRMSAEDWQAVINTNLNSVFYTCSAVIRSMIKARSGSIINLSSVVGLLGSPGQTNYAAAKAGIIGFTKALAKEVSARNIRVNCIAPGFIDTDMTRVLNDKVKASILSNIPMGRMGSAEEIAYTALFLASPMSSYITSQVLSVDGGMA